jgi:hypothetical protein
LKIELLVKWSRRWMEAERDLNQSKTGRIAAIEAHRTRLKKWEDLVSELREGGSEAGADLALDTLAFERLEAETWLAQAKAEP